MRYTVSIADRTVRVEVKGNTVLLDGRPIRATLVAIPRTPLRQLVVNGQARTFAMTRGTDGWKVQCAGRWWPVAVLDERTRQVRELTGQRAKHAAGGLIKAPMPGLVLRVEVEVGQRVEQGAGLVVLEAMKMENEIKTPGPGVVQAIHVAAGQAVEKGMPLVAVGEQEG